MRLREHTLREWALGRFERSLGTVLSAGQLALLGMGLASEVMRIVALAFLFEMGARPE